MEPGRGELTQPAGTEAEGRAAGSASHWSPSRLCAHWLRRSAAAPGESLLGLRSRDLRVAARPPQATTGERCSSSRSYPVTLILSRNPNSLLDPPFADVEPPPGLPPSLFLLLLFFSCFPSSRFPALRFPKILPGPLSWASLPACQLLTSAPP